MKKRLILTMLVIVLLAWMGGLSGPLSGQAKTRPVATNKAKLLTLAVQGQIGHAQPSRSYVTTWDGKPKMAIGTGGINYNLRVGDKVFGWAGADRATVGVAAEGADERNASSWMTMTSIGNEVKVLGGDARGSRGVVVGT